MGFGNSKAKTKSAKHEIILEEDTDVDIKPAKTTKRRKYWVDNSEAEVNARWTKFLRQKSKRLVYPLPPMVFEDTTQTKLLKNDMGRKVTAF